METIFGIVFWTFAVVMTILHFFEYSLRPVFKKDASTYNKLVRKVMVLGMSTLFAIWIIAQFV